jgi:hypothetical protein
MSNLIYLYLGSIKLIRYSIRYSIQYLIQYLIRYSIRYRIPKSGPEQKGVLINWSSWKLRTELDAKESRHKVELNSEVHEPGVLTQSRAEIQSLRTRITSNQFQITYWRPKFVDRIIFIINLYQHQFLSWRVTDPIR